MTSYASILVGTDGSESSFLAVDRAAAIAGDTGAVLVLVSAYRQMPPKEQARAAAELGHDAYKVSGSAPAEDVLGRARDRAVAAGAGQVDTLAVSGDPVDVLVHVAQDRRIGLLVIGNRGLNSLAGRLLGSVPQNVMHRAACDVLIVHTTG